MYITDIVLSVVLLLFCIYSMISDIKTGKIKNLILLIMGGITLSAALIKLIFFDRDDLFLYLENAGILLLIGLAGYAFKLWAGGDCKVLALIAVSYPTLFYFDYNQLRLTLWLIPVAAFIISFIFLLADSVISVIGRKNKIDSKQMLATLKRYLLLYIKAFVYITAWNQIYAYFIFPYVQIHPAVYLFVSILLVFVINKFKVLGNLWVLICVAAFGVAMMFISGRFTIITYWRNYLLVFLFMILKSFMSLYNYKVIPVEETSAGMVLSRTDTLFMQQSRVKGLPDISDETLRSRITADEAESIKRWGKSKYGKPQVTIVRKIPFAAFLSVGTIVYFLVGVLQFCGLL